MTARASCWFRGSAPGQHRLHPAQAASTEQTIRNQNFYANTSFDINDRYILDGLIRRDGSSLFGPEARWQTYYRISGAWRANEDLKISGIDELRLRASFGTAGLRPGFDAQYETLTPVGGAFNKATLGNKFLKPAHSEEFEAGFNLRVQPVHGRVHLLQEEHQGSDPAVALPSVVGFASQWQNTVPSSQTPTSFRSARSWSIRAASPGSSTLWRSHPPGHQRLDLPIRLYGFGQMPAVFYLNKGATLGEMRGQRAVKCGSYGTAVTLDREITMTRPRRRNRAPDRPGIRPTSSSTRKATW